CLASDRERPAPFVTSPPPSMATKSRTERRRTTYETATASAVRPLPPEGDRSAMARLVIVALVLGLAVTVLLSLTSGASDASAWSAAIDALFPSTSADAVPSARDRIIIHDIRLPR